MRRRPFALCLQAAEQGHAGAQAYVAYCYHTGQRPVRRSYRRALHWYRLSAEQGYMRAQFSLAWMYLLGRGSHKNLRRSAYWFSGRRSRAAPSHFTACRGPTGSVRAFPVMSKRASGISNRLPWEMSLPLSTCWVSIIFWERISCRTWMRPSAGWKPQRTRRMPAPRRPCPN